MPIAYVCAVGRWPPPFVRLATLQSGGFIFRSHVISRSWGVASAMCAVGAEITTHEPHGCGGAQGIHKELASETLGEDAW